jgi:hypothetical protein
MECLQKILCGEYALVGVRDFVNCPHPETILFINDLGITLKQASAIANDEQRTGIELIQSKIRIATQKVFNRFSTMISDQFDFNNIVEAREISKFSNNTHAPAALERGLVIRRWRSEAARIFIENVYVRTEESGIAYIKIYDGDVTKVYEASLLANTTNEIEIRYKCKSEHVRVVFDQTNFTTFSCDIDDEAGCHTCGTSYGSVKRTLEVKGWDGTEETDECFGLGVLANVQCFEEEILCMALPRMAFLFWYQSGIEILNEHVNTGRINAVATFTKDQAKSMLEDLKVEMKTEEKQFSKNIANFLKTTRGECFTCKGTRYNYATG